MSSRSSIGASPRIPFTSIFSCPFQELRSLKWSFTTLPNAILLRHQNKSKNSIRIHVHVPISGAALPVAKLHNTSAALLPERSSKCPSFAHSFANFSPSIFSKGIRSLKSVQTFLNTILVHLSWSSKIILNNSGSKYSILYTKLL